MNDKVKAYLKAQQNNGRLQISLNEALSRVAGYGEDHAMHLAKALCATQPDKPKPKITVKPRSEWVPRVGNFAKFENIIVRVIGQRGEQFNIKSPQGGIDSANTSELTVPPKNALDIWLREKEAWKRYSKKVHSGATVTPSDLVTLLDKISD